MPHVAFLTRRGRIHASAFFMDHSKTISVGPLLSLFGRIHDIYSDDSSFGMAGSLRNMPNLISLRINDFS